MLEPALCCCPEKKTVLLEDHRDEDSPRPLCQLPVPHKVNTVRKVMRQAQKQVRTHSLHCQPGNER